jgi:hypothetical protein
MLHWIPGYEQYASLDDKLRTAPRNGVSKEEHLARYDISKEHSMKTLYFQSEEGLIGGVVPATERVDTTRLEHLADVKVCGMATQFPYAQSPGTCGPWFSREDKSRIYKVVFDASGSGPSEWVIPGEERLSLIGSYEDVYNALNTTYPSIYDVGEIAEKSL